MNHRHIRRTLFACSFALTWLLPAATTMAAIPCHEQEVIPAPPDMAIPMIYIELPVDPSMLLGRGQLIDRSTANPASDEDAGSARSAAMNQLRCLNYGSSDIVLGNSTPGFRVMTTGVMNPEAGEEYVKIDAAHLVQFGDVRELHDGRLLIDYTAVIDGDRFFDGEMIFVEQNGNLYLDGAAIRNEIELGDSHDVEVSERFTREVNVVEMLNGESLTFDNQSTESMANIVITDTNGETIFEGNAMAEGMVGGETQHVFVPNYLDPGDYTATVAFEESGIEMNVTIRIGQSPGTPEAATPQS